MPMHGQDGRRGRAGRPAAPLPPRHIVLIHSHIPQIRNPKLKSENSNHEILMAERPCIDTEWSV